MPTIGRRPVLRERSTYRRAFLGNPSTQTGSWREALVRVREGVLPESDLRAKIRT
jgi:hypothetical protein